MEGHRFSTGIGFLLFYRFLFFGHKISWGKELGA